MQKLTPAGYLSYSQFHAYKISIENYRKKYILGKDFKNDAMIFGGDFAKLMELGQDSDDEIVEHIKNFIPKYPKCKCCPGEHEIRAQFKDIELYGKLDGFEPRKFKVGEYKTGKMWTQEKVDKDEQLTFYAFILWLNTEKVPKLELTSIETENSGGKIHFTGKIETFETVRTYWQLLKIGGEIREVWEGIIKLAQREYKNI